LDCCGSSGEHYGGTTQLKTRDHCPVNVGCYESSACVDTVPDGPVMAAVADVRLAVTGSGVATTARDASDELEAT
jgi:hypothetical protein